MGKISEGQIKLSRKEYFRMKKSSSIARNQYSKYKPLLRYRQRLLLIMDLSVMEGSFYVYKKIFIRTYLKHKSARRDKN